MKTHLGFLAALVFLLLPTFAKAETVTRKLDCCDSKRLYKIMPKASTGHLGWKKKVFKTDDQVLDIKCKKRWFTKYSCTVKVTRFEMMSTTMSDERQYILMELTEEDSTRFMGKRTEVHFQTDDRGFSINCSIETGRCLIEIEKPSL